MKLRTPADDECELFCVWFKYVIRLTLSLSLSLSLVFFFFGRVDTVLNASFKS
jgi:hypothetical protein